MKDIDYYKSLPYTTILRRDEDGDVVARVDELQGCAAHGKTPQEALESLEEAKDLWIRESLDAGSAIPEPEAESLPSGKWLQRVPRSLHRRLSLLARGEGVSLNQLVTSILAEAVGRRVGAEQAPAEGRSVWHAVSKHPGEDLSGVGWHIEIPPLQIGGAKHRFMQAILAPLSRELTFTEPKGKIHGHKNKEESYPAD